MKKSKTLLLVFALVVCSIISSFSQRAIDDVDLPPVDEGGELVCSTSYSIVLAAIFPPLVVVVATETCSYQ